jgi:hypothetical protein
VASRPVRIWPEFVQIERSIDAIFRPPKSIATLSGGTFQNAPDEVHGYV